MPSTQLWDLLESRLFLSVSVAGGKLTILGTPGNDSVVLSQDANGIRVSDGGVITSGLAVNSISQILIDLGEGNDLASFKPTVSAIPATILGGNGNDSLTGGAGSDSISGAVGDDSLSGGLGADTIDGGDGSDTTDYSASLRRIVVSLDGIANDGGVPLPKGTLTDEFDNVLTENVIGSNFDDDIRGDSNTNSLNGGPGNDYVRSTLNDQDPGGGLDSLFGSTGNDFLDGIFLGFPLYLQGGKGDDFLRGGVKSDLFIGGAGADTVSYTNRGENLNITLDSIANDGAASLNETDNVMSDVEGVLTGSGKDTITGSAGNNTIKGGAGGDSIDGGLGNDLLDGQNAGDILIGGAGIDTVDYSTRTIALAISGDGVANDGNVDAQNPTLSAEFDNIAADIEILLGGAANDTITGSTGNNTIKGGAGNDSINGADGDDYLDGQTGADTLIGGVGVDTTDYSARAVRVVVYLDGLSNDGEVSTPTGVQSTEFDNVQTENVIGSSLNDDLRGDANSNLLDGGPGDDYVRSTMNDTTAGAGNDTLLGGTGTDFLDGIFSNAAMLLDGGAGDDLIRTGPKTDVVIGGTGLDTVSYNNRGEDLSITLDGIANDGAASKNENDNVGVDIENVITGSGRDTIIGSGGDNFINGGKGTDSLVGGPGDDLFVNAEDIADTIVGGAGFDVAQQESVDTFQQIELFYAREEGTPSAPLSARAALAGGDAAPAGGEVIDGILYITGETTLDGAPVADSISILQSGGFINISQNDAAVSYAEETITRIIIDSGGGNDAISLRKYSDGSRAVAVPTNIASGSGNDDITGGGSSDNIGAGPGNDRVVAGAGSDSVDGGTGNDNLEGEGGNDLLNGSAGNDTLSGAAGNDKLNGGNDSLPTADGADNLSGGSGNDFVFYTARTDNLIVDLSDDEGATDGAAGEGDIVHADIEYVLSGAGDDSLIGTAGANLLAGGDGNDTILAGDGSDILIGDGGTDSVDGQLGIAAVINLTDQLRDDFEGSGTLIVQGDSTIDYDQVKKKFL